MLIKSLFLRFVGFLTLKVRGVNRFQIEIKNANSINSPYPFEELFDYLKKWRYSTNIAKLPLMEKCDIKAFVEKLDKKQVYKFFYTGGSTGEPLQIAYSKRKVNWRLASALFYNKFAGYTIGDPYLLTRSRDRNKIIKFFRNETILVPNNLSEIRIKQFWSEIKRRKIKFLIGYPSVLFNIAELINKMSLEKKESHLRGIITTAEPLDESQLECIYSAFECPVLNRYANEECGIIAQQWIHGGELLVNRFGIFVEVVDPKTLLPVKPGQTGKVIVTDLFSDLYPMVRYNTGDLAEAGSYDSAGVLLTIKNIQGRTVDQFKKTNGEPFSPLTLGPYIRVPLTKAGYNVQFQFAQLSNKEFELRLKTYNNFLDSIIKNQIINGLKEVIGLDARIKITLVKEIVPLKSGKKPLYINEYFRLSNS